MPRWKSARGRKEVGALVSKRILLPLFNEAVQRFLSSISCNIVPSAYSCALKLEQAEQAEQAEPWMIMYKFLWGFPSMRD